MNEVAKELQQKIVRLEKYILQRPQEDFPMIHWLEGSMYYRAIFIPKGKLITGAKHRLEHTCVSIGDIEVSTDFGMKRLTGYNHFWAEAGKKRIGFTFEDTIWLTIHWTDQKTLEGIEEWLSFPDEHKLLAMVRDRRNRGILHRSNMPQLIEH